jgi:hypothetical protein
VHPELATRILKSLETKIKDDRLGLTSADKRLKNLTSFGRAEYFLNKMDTMPANELGEYLRVMQERDVLTPKVARIIREMQMIRANQ